MRMTANCNVFVVSLATESKNRQGVAEKRLQKTLLSLRIHGPSADP